MKRRNREERREVKTDVGSVHHFSFPRKIQDQGSYPVEENGNMRHYQYIILSLCDSTSKQKLPILHKVLESKFKKKK